MSTSKNGNLMTRMSRYGATSRMAGVIIAFVTVLLVGTTAVMAEDGIGKINGTVIDASTGEAIIGATLMLVQGETTTQMGARADLDGNYWIRNIPAGTYTVRISSVGYQSQDITGVEVAEGETFELNVTLNSQVLETDTKITVKGVLKNNTEAVMLKERAAAASSQDAISAEDISRSGSGTADEAMANVVGASKVGDHVYIRGLGDRYSNTHLNGSPLPSPDPDRQDAPIDMIPAGLLDNIVVAKTFTPDKPGNFAGGSANLATKDYPEERSLKFSTSVGYNSIATNNDSYLTHSNSSTDWLGYDDGRRDLPQIVLDNPGMQSAVDGIPKFIKILDTMVQETKDSLWNLAYYVDSSAKAFGKEMTPGRQTAPLNQSYSLSYGDMFMISERPLGIVASLTYSRKHKVVEGGERGIYAGAGAASQEAGIVWDEGTDNVLWGGLGSLTFSPHDKHKFSTSFMYNRNGEQVNTFSTARWPYHYDEHPNDSLRLRFARYVERELRVLQFSGEHAGLPLLGDRAKDVRTEWSASLARTSQDEPDSRYVGDVRAYLEDWEDEGWASPWIYRITPTGTELPSRSWRTLEENKDEFKVDLTLPMSRSLKVKTGVSYVDKDRTYRDRRFDYTNSRYWGSVRANEHRYLDSMGIRDTIRFGSSSPSPDDDGISVYFHNWVDEVTGPLYQYDGYQKITGFYGMVETVVPGIDKLTFVGGVRFENTDMYGAVQDTAKDEGRIDENTALPSANFIYRATDNSNIRFSYGRTLARPTIREMTPVPTERFGSDKSTFIGNENLQQTEIDNWDLRWEWFVRPGEVVAISGFHKKFTNPIELGFIGLNGNVFIQNVPTAEVWGLEFEYRRRLDWFWAPLANFQLGSNLTLVSSRQDYPETEIKAYPEYADPDRPMFNQSPFVVNADIGYSNPRTGTSASIFYNVFGRRIALNSQLPTPDVYEEPRHQLNFVAKQRLFSVDLKFSVKNILNEDVLYKYDGQRDDGEGNKMDAIYNKYSKGVDVGIGISYSIM